MKALRASVIVSLMTIAAAPAWAQALPPAGVGVQGATALGAQMQNNYADQQNNAQKYFAYLQQQQAQQQLQQQQAQASQAPPVQYHYDEKDPNDPLSNVDLPERLFNNIPDHNY